ncbi:MAG: DUF3800 domain-containing protein [Chloroflexota bacterium]
MASPKVMFLDESGDHSLKVIDPQYPVFVLGGVIVEAEYANGEMTERVRQFKQDLFGRTDLILHTADITRARNGFERLLEPAFRQEFYARLNELMRVLEYSVVACAIRKDLHVLRYRSAAVDPYAFSLEILVERFCFEIGNNPDGGRMVVEQRDPTLDRQLMLAWETLKNRGTDYLRPITVQQRIVGLHPRPKRENLAGLQLADLVVSPIGRFVLGKQTHEDFGILEAKFRRRKGDYHGAGLVVLPRGS